MEVDYIIVGLGLAGLSFCEHLRINQKSFVVFDDSSQQSSLVAAGLYNPVVLKRFTPVWKSKEQLENLNEFYRNIERRLNVRVDFPLPVYRKFASLEEQNDWFIACDKPRLGEYLNSEVVQNINDHIIAPLGFGKVNSTGRIDIKCLIGAYKKELQQSDQIIEVPFDYGNLILEWEKINYNDIKTQHIVFVEGFGMKKNPFFNNLPLMGTKGELLTIHAPDLKLSYVVKSSVFIVPIGNDRYIVGSTYNWENKSNKITEDARRELLKKLESLISCSYEVEQQVAGIRPTVRDRRPLVGNHSKFKNLHILNGLGTRGVMIAPYVSEKLYNNIELNEPLDAEIDIKRFE